MVRGPVELVPCVSVLLVSPKTCQRLACYVASQRCVGPRPSQLHLWKSIALGGASFVAGGRAAGVPTLPQHLFLSLLVGRRTLLAVVSHWTLHCLARG